MSTPFIFAVQSETAKAFNRDEMKKRERRLANRYNLEASSFDTCIETEDGEGNHDCDPDY